MKAYEFDMTKHPCLASIREFDYLYISCANREISIDTKKISVVWYDSEKVCIYVDDNNFYFSFDDYLSVVGGNHKKREYL